MPSEEAVKSEDVTKPIMFDRRSAFNQVLSDLNTKFADKDPAFKKLLVKASTEADLDSISFKLEPLRKYCVNQLRQANGENALVAFNYRMNHKFLGQLGPRNM